MQITALYKQHLAEQKHCTFTKWRASGYRDLVAWNEFIRLFVAMQGL